MGKSKVLVKVHPEGKYVVDLDKDIDIAQVCPPACICKCPISDCFLCTVNGPVQVQICIAGACKITNTSGRPPMCCLGCGRSV
jgi:hypothetical protein